MANAELFMRRIKLIKDDLKLIKSLKIVCRVRSRTYDASNQSTVSDQKPVLAQF